MEVEKGFLCSLPSCCSGVHFDRTTKLLVLGPGNMIFIDLHERFKSTNLLFYE